MVEQNFYSNGKLLLTAEYIVLDGARALALPTIFGQQLSVIENNSETISWKSYNHDKSVWVDVIFTFSEIIEKNFYKNTEKSKLAQILYQTHILSPNFLTKNKGYRIETRLSFPKVWGLGSSSTLINNIAKWQGINPYQLLKNTFGGSGYDIACAQNNTPILFCRTNKVPFIKKVNFNLEFSENLYFVYLNKKQNSAEAILEYKKQEYNAEKIIHQINQITYKVIETKSLNEFSDLLEQHEQIISGVLNMQTVKERLFPDFKGTIKSLGAWGGDFVLAVSSEDPTQYFKEKGFYTIFTYKEMIL